MEVFEERSDIYNDRLRFMAGYRLPGYTTKDRTKLYTEYRRYSKPFLAFLFSFRRGTTLISPGYVTNKLFHKIFLNESALQVPHPSFSLLFLRGLRLSMTFQLNGVNDTGKKTVFLISDS